MRILFLHQNFPGQFTHLAPALAARGHEVVALTSRFAKSTTWRGVRVIAYRWTPPGDQRLHPFLNTLNQATHRGVIVHRAALALRERGFTPDVVIAHSGWGEALFVREVWPGARLGVFSEFYYQAAGADVDFDPEFAGSGELARAGRIRLRNMAMRMQLEGADASISPTRWQADTYPPGLRERIEVVHDGIDTAAVRPEPAAVFAPAAGPRLTAGDEVITFVNRNLEPYRGYHVFMRALPDLLAARPRAQVVVVGEDGVSYGTRPKQGGTWKEIFADEVRGRIPDADWARVHFVGRLEHAALLALFQVSTVHVYLTYPFVLSWSLLEAMSAGCAVVASGTDPVREVIDDGVEGVLVDFFDAPRLARTVAGLAADPDRRAALGAAARARVVRDYDLAAVCLPAQFDWVERLAAMTPGPVAV